MVETEEADFDFDAHIASLIAKRYLQCCLSPVLCE